MAETWVYRQLWSDGSHSLHSHQADINAFAHEYYNKGGAKNREIIGNSTPMLTSRKLKGKYGDWE